MIVIWCSIPWPTRSVDEQGRIINVHGFLVDRDKVGKMRHQMPAERGQKELETMKKRNEWAEFVAELSRQARDQEGQGAMRIIRKGRIILPA